MKSPVMTLLAMIALFLILIQPSSVSGQSDVFEFDAVVFVDGWSSSYSGSDSDFGLAYLWVKSNDLWFGPSRLLNDGSIEQPIQIDQGKLPETGVDFAFYLSGSEETPTSERLLFLAYEWRLLQESVGEPGIAYVIEAEVSFHNPDDDGDGIPTLDEAFMLWHAEVNDEFMLVTSDPFNQDTDRDGLEDGTEVRGVNEWACRTDPRLEDSDGDGLTDIQEIRSNACQEDTDGDGLFDGDELVNGTDPLDPDNDQDGLMDGPEVLLFNTNPLITDSDGDGLKDGEEALRYFTEPLDPDSDGDGLGDAEEILRYNTNPMAVDSDEDGLTDKEEPQTYNTDALDPDSDDDDLPDGDEVLLHNTNPLDSDTDGDEVNDGDEVLRYQTNPLNSDGDEDLDGLKDHEEILRYQTNPLNPDHDGDELWDGDEIRSHNTDPLNPDSDGDGYTDGEEVLRKNSDPLVADSGVTLSANDCEPSCPTSEPLVSTFGWVLIGAGIIAALGVGYVVCIFWKITSTAAKIENSYGFSRGDSLGESTDEFNRLNRWPLAKQLYRLRWKGQ